LFKVITESGEIDYQLNFVSEMRGVVSDITKNIGVLVVKINEVDGG